MTPYLTLCREFVAIDSCAVLIAHEIWEVLPVPSRLKTGASTYLSGKRYLSQARSSHVDWKMYSFRARSSHVDWKVYSGQSRSSHVNNKVLSERSMFEGSDFSHGEAHPAMRLGKSAAVRGVRAAAPSRSLPRLGSVRRGVIPRAIIFCLDATERQNTRIKILSNSRISLTLTSRLASDHRSIHGGVDVCRSME